MSTNETVTETPVTPAPEAQNDDVVLTFNKKKIRRIVVASTSAAAAVAGAFVFFKKAQENVTVEPLETEWTVIETPVND